MRRNGMRSAARMATPNIEDIKDITKNMALGNFNKTTKPNEET